MNIAAGQYIPLITRECFILQLEAVVSLPTGVSW